MCRCYLFLFKEIHLHICFLGSDFNLFQEVEDAEAEAEEDDEEVEESCRSFLRFRGTAASAAGCLEWLTCFEEAGREADLVVVDADDDDDDPTMLVEVDEF